MRRDDLLVMTAMPMARARDRGVLVMSDGRSRAAGLGSATAADGTVRSSSPSKCGRSRRDACRRRAAAGRAGEFFKVS